MGLIFISCNPLGGDQKAKQLKFKGSRGITPALLTLKLTTINNRTHFNAPFKANIKANFPIVPPKIENFRISGAEIVSIAPLGDNSYDLHLNPHGTNGAHSMSLKVEAGKIQTARGLKNQESNSLSLFYDGLGPNINLVNNDPQVVSGPFFVQAFVSEATGYLLPAHITTTNATISNFNQVSANEYQFTIMPTSTGAVSVEVLPDQVHDLSGNGNHHSNRIEKAYFNTTEQFNVVLSSPSPQNINTSFLVDIILNKPLTNIANNPIQVTNGIVSNITGSDQVFQVIVTPTNQGEVVVSIPANSVFHGPQGNSNTATLTRNFDSIAPGVVLETNEQGPITNSWEFDVKINFSEPVTGFNQSKIDISNAEISNFTQTSSMEYNFKLSPLAEGPIQLNLAQGSGHDLAMNPSQPLQWQITFQEPEYNGAQLYFNHCAECHDPLSSSTIFNKTAADIQYQLANEPEMADLQGVITVKMTEAIALALVNNNAPTSNPSGPTFSSLSCDPSSAEPEISPLRRLTKEEYKNSLDHVLSDNNIFSNFRGQVSGSLSPVLSMVPKENSRHHFASEDHGTNDQHIDGYFFVANTAATLMVETPNALRSFYDNSCIEQSAVTNNCLNGFFNELLKLAFKRPAKPDEISRYIDHFRSQPNNADGFKMVFNIALLSPQFLYHIELDGTPIDGREDYLQLDPFELANKISFTFLGKPAEDKLNDPHSLWDAAADGSILNNQELQAQLVKIFQRGNQNRNRDPSTPIQSQYKIGEFYNQLYKLDNTQWPDHTNSIFHNSFAKGYHFGEGNWSHRQQLNNDTKGFIFDRTWNSPGESFYDLLMSTERYIDHYSNPVVHMLYDIINPVYNNGNFHPYITLPGNLYYQAFNRPLTPFPGTGYFNLPDPKRAGLLTLPTIMMTGSYQKNPITRGVFVMERLLCDDVPSPNLNTLPPRSLEPVAAHPTWSNRQRYEHKTADAQCQVCHQKINAFGAPMEDMDALGRSEGPIEGIWDPFQGDDPIGYAAIDASSIVEIDGAQVAVNGTKELSEAIGSSTQGNACFARQYFRFTTGKKETQNDSCMIKHLYDNLTGQSGSIENMFYSYGQHPFFKRVKIGPKD